MSEASGLNQLLGAQRSMLLSNDLNVCQRMYLYAHPVSMKMIAPVHADMDITSSAVGVLLLMAMFVRTRAKKNIART